MAKGMRVKLNYEIGRDPDTGVEVTRLTPPEVTCHRNYFYQKCFFNDGSHLLFAGAFDGHWNYYLLDLQNAEAVQKLGAWQTLSSDLAPAEDVRGALALVERNEAPLGIVYGSDAVASKGVKVVGTFPEDAHKKVEYPVAIVDGHKNATVTAFQAYLKGPEASAIFKRYGFTTHE